MVAAAEVAMVVAVEVAMEAVAAPITMALVVELVAIYGNLKAVEDPSHLALEMLYRLQAPTIQFPPAIQVTNGKRVYQEGLGVVDFCFQRLLST